MPRWTTLLGAAIALLASTAARADSLVVADDPQGIYGGAPVDACGWPSAVFVGGCTGSLVHPKMVVLAAHCVAYGSPTEVAFGENFSSPARTVPLDGCLAHPQWGQGMPGDGQHDIAICELAEPVVDVPIVPIAMGCETEMLDTGVPATLVGFGEADDGLGMGPKREVATEIQQVGTDAIWVGDGVHSACYGDSGGPAYVMLPDGSWRVFGATSGASMLGDCPQTGVWTLIHPYVPWIEQMSGLDVTPCHDATGEWNPTAECTSFPMQPGAGGSEWAQGCAGEASGPSASCGPAFDEGSADTGESTGTIDESSSSDDGGDESTSDGGSATTTGDEGDLDTSGDEQGTETGSATAPATDPGADSGCSCGSDRGHGAGWMLLLPALFAAARRRQ